MGRHAGRRTRNVARNTAHKLPLGIAFCIIFIRLEQTTVRERLEVSSVAPSIRLTGDWPEPNMRTRTDRKVKKCKDLLTDGEALAAIWTARCGLTGSLS